MQLWMRLLLERPLNSTGKNSIELFFYVGNDLCPLWACHSTSTMQLAVLKFFKLPASHISYSSLFDIFL